MIDDAPLAPSSRRRPDWRRCRALELYRSGRPASRRQDDPLIHLLVRYYRQRRQAASCVLASQPDADLQNVAAAIELHDSAPPLQRTLVEAYLLAGAASGEISGRLGLPPAVIDAYHALCYDVRSRLQHPELMIAIAILGSPAGAGSEPRRHAAIKALAYLAGPAALVKLFSASSAGSGDLSGWTSTLVEGADALLNMAQYLAVLASDPGSSAVAQQMLHQSIARRGRERRPESLSRLEQHMKQLLEDIPWMVGPGQPGDGPPQLAELDQAGAELRDDELMRVARGEKLENAEEILNLKLPPPRRREGPAQGDWSLE